MNGIIQLVDGELLIITTSSCINIYMVYYSDLEINISFYLAFVVPVILIALFAALYLYVRCKMNLVEPGKFKVKQDKLKEGKRINSVYSNYAIKKVPRTVIVVLFVSIARRILLSMIITFGQGNILSNNILVNASSYMFIALIGYTNLLKSNFQRRLGLFNEYMVLVVMIHLVCQTGYVTRLD